MVLSADPRGADLRVHLVGAEILRQHPLKRGDVDLKRRPVDRCAARLLELLAHVPGQVLGRGQQLAVGVS